MMERVLQTMTVFPDVLFINTSPSLQKLHGPLCTVLAHVALVGCWDYQQTADEPLSLEVGTVLLHDYLKRSDRPLHLIGHGSSGCLAWLYARRYPERVRSLTLLAVGPQATYDWHADYYARFRRQPCSRLVILRQMVQGMFGPCPQPLVGELVQLLDRDLQTALSPQTLYQLVESEAGPVEVPLLVCGSRDDRIIAPETMQGWQAWLKPEDALWLCSSGWHFFHHAHPGWVARRIVDFWLAVNLQPRDRPRPLKTLSP